MSAGISVAADASATWMVSLRPARYYKPYSVTLQKFTHEKYAGTEIPKNFSSKVTLIDPERSVNRDVLIYMRSARNALTKDVR